MRALFHASLPNGLSGDPVLLVDMPDVGQAVLIDLGELHRVPPRKLLRVERVVVTHAHMDHFIGFDHLLRIALGRQRELRLTGPRGFLGHVQGRIDGYTWNLIDSYPVHIVAEEVDGVERRATAWRGAGGLRPEPLPTRADGGPVHVERAWTLRVTELDHGIPVLAALLEETEHLSVDRDRLVRMGLRPGAWLSELKDLVRRRRPSSTPIEVTTAAGDERAASSGELAEALLTRTPGMRLAYVTDIAPTEENLERAAAFVHGADLLVCETAFLDADDALARRRRHLTARRSGELARAAAVGRLAPFHVSPRYQGREDELLGEAAAAFGGPVVRLPGAPATDIDG